VQDFKAQELGVEGVTAGVGHEHESGGVSGELDVHHGGLAIEHGVIETSGSIGFQGSSNCKSSSLRVRHNEIVAENHDRGLLQEH